MPGARGSLSCGPPRCVGRGSAAAALSLVTLVSRAFYVVAQAGIARNAGVQLYHHSFERELTYDGTLGDWLSSAATMALRDSVQLLPPVPDRYSVFWNRGALGTGDFEVSFTFSGYDKDKLSRVEDGFIAAWISLDNFSSAYNEQAIVTASKDWKIGMEAEGFTFLNNKPNFRGLAVVFLGKDGTGASKQSITGLWSDGSKALTLADVFAENPSTRKTKYIDWLTKGTQVKLRVNKDGSIVGSVMMLDLQKHFAGTNWGWSEDGEKVDASVTFELDYVLKDKDGAKIGTWEVLQGNRISMDYKGEQQVFRLDGSHRAIRESPRAAGLKQPVLYYGSKTDLPNDFEWTEAFTLPAGTFPVSSGSPTPCFVGFSGWSGSESWVQVDLHRMETRNFDMSRLGEASTDDDSDAWLQVLESEKRYVSQADQKEAVQRLTKLLSEHVDKFDKAGETIKEELVKMDSRMDAIVQDFSTYFVALHSLNQESQQFDLKDHIVGIRSILQKDKETHDTMLSNVQIAAQKLKEGTQSRSNSDEGRAKAVLVADQARAVEDFASKGSSRTSILLILIVFSVAGFGLMFFNRMRYYEKKNFI